MGKIFYIMGKSASGKDRIYSLLAAHKELNLKTLILYTTRPIRAGDEVPRRRDSGIALRSAGIFAGVRHINSFVFMSVSD